MADPIDVKALRAQLGLTQAGLARLLAVEVRTVARWEAGRASPTGTVEAVLLAFREALAGHAAGSALARTIAVDGAERGLRAILIELLTYPRIAA